VDGRLRGHDEKVGGIARQRGLFSALLLAFLFLSTLAALAAPNFPALTGRVVDQAGIIPYADRQELEQSLKELEAKSSDQLVVVTLKSLEGLDIADYGYQLGRFWKIGQAPLNNGVLLIIAPNDRKLRIEVGRGLEPQLTDIMSGLIVNNAILPGFRRGDPVAGIKAGVRDISAVLLGDGEEVKRRAMLGKRPPKTDLTDYLPLLFMALWIGIVLYSMFRQQQQMRSLPPSQQARRRFGDGNVIIIPGGWGGSGGWSGGGSSGGGGDGGFSGGGGDFGGGGASGDW
jgi:uncharacterized protein